MSAKDLLPFIPNITMYPRKHLKDKIMSFMIIKKGYMVFRNIYIIVKAVEVVSKKEIIPHTV